MNKQNKKIAEKILAASRKLPAGEHSCEDVEREMLKQGIEVGPGYIRGLLGASAALEISGEDLSTAATVLERVTELALVETPADIGHNRRLADQMTQLLNPQLDPTVEDLSKAIAWLLEAADQLRAENRQRELLLHRE